MSSSSTVQRPGGVTRTDILNLIAQHTREVLRDVLGVSDDEIGKLAAAGVVGTGK